MKKVIAYALLDAGSKTEVMEHIKDNWQPWGAPFVFEGFATQAMVKYEEDMLVTCSSDSDE